MTLPVVVTAGAERQAKSIDRWWRANRTAAPDLFQNEFAAALELVGFAPLSGRRYGRASGVDVRRILLRASRYHLYYVVREEDAVVLAVWSAVRGTGPDLGNFGESGG